MASLTAPPTRVRRRPSGPPAWLIGRGGRRAGLLTEVRRGAWRRLGAPSVGSATAGGGRRRRGRYSVVRMLRRSADQWARVPSLPPKRPDSCICRRKSSWLIWLSVQWTSPIGRPAMNAVRFAASSGAMPRIRRWRYVTRVAMFLAVGGLDDARRVGVPVPDPDPAAEAAASTGEDEPPRDDRSCARDPRRARPAMVHRAVLSLPLPRFDRSDGTNPGPPTDCVGGSSDRRRPRSMTHRSHASWYLRRRPPPYAPDGRSRCPDGPWVDSQSCGSGSSSCA